MPEFGDVLLSCPSVKAPDLRNIIVILRGYDYYGNV
jgi:hypothetical protein